MKNSELILNYIERHNTSCYKVAQATGISESTFSKWKTKPTSKVDLSIVQKIAVFFDTTIDNILETNQRQNNSPNLSIDELNLLSNYKALNDLDKIRVSERAEMLAELAAERAAQEAEKISKEKYKTAETKPIIVAPAADEEPEEDEEFYIDLCNLPVSAGTGVYLDEGFTEPLQIKRTVTAERANYAVRVSGNSMEPKFYDGDIVLVETCPYVEVGEIGIFIVDDEGFIKKRGEDRLISLNPKCDDVIIHEYDTVYCRGRVLGKAEIVE